MEEAVENEDLYQKHRALGFVDLVWNNSRLGEMNKVLIVLLVSVLSISKVPTQLVLYLQETIAHGRLIKELIQAANSW